MSERHELIGADDVRSAGHTIRHAAEQMSSAAMTMDGAACRHQQALEQQQAFFEDWLQRLEAVLYNDRMERKRG